MRTDPVRGDGPRGRTVERGGTPGPRSNALAVQTAALLFIHWTLCVAAY
ncbi:MAG: hypothetical protein ACYSU0_10330 [Planctomycetota bacterium]